MGSHSVSGAGDINGDGFDDVVIGSPYATNKTGQSFVVFGHVGPFAPVLDLATLTSGDGFHADGGAANEISGSLVSSAGDINGDGLDDLLIAAAPSIPDGVRVVFGNTSFPLSLPMSALDDKGAAFTQADPDSSTGSSIASAGDINGDGIDDLIVGAALTSGAAQSAGASFVVFGTNGAFPATVALAGLNGINGFRINGVAQYDGAGSALRAAGDVNGDGLADLMVGASGADNGGEVVSAGGVQAHVGRCWHWPGLNGSNGFRLDGAAAFESSGVALGAAGDMNGDGYDDVLVAAPGARDCAGATYVVFGHAAGNFADVVNLGALNGADGIRLDGTLAGDNSGLSVSATGDVNGDGYDDVIIGAASAFQGVGASYLVYGHDSPTAWPSMAVMTAAPCSAPRQTKA